MDVQLSWFVYVVRLTDTFNQEQRDAIVRMLHQRGIGCGRYFAPIHSQPAYADLPLRWPLPITESISRRTLALPFFSRLREEEVEQVTHALRESIDAASH
jgi:perosamine synthetase